MRKEVLFAVIIGVLLGAIVAFGVWRANLALVSQKNQGQTQSSPTLKAEEEIKTSQLVITEPENNLVVSSDKITIKGSAQPLSTIVILANSENTIFEAGSDGSIEQEVELVGGPNKIIVIAYDKDGNESKQTLNIVYSTEFEEE